MKSLHLLILNLFISASSFAQPMADLSLTNDDEVIIVGKVKDQESGEPLAFATIAILDASDSSLVSGIATDIDGKFELKSRPGNYILRLQYVSYKDEYIDDIEFESGNDFFNVGEIMMASDAEVLKEVIVTASQPQMQLELDKRVFNVSENLNSVGSTADQLMDNLPSVSVDVDGTVSLRGSTNVRILVNGKPSGLIGINGTDGLRQLQADLIDRIEVITNPSARYDAEGSAGIINIILKKDLERGFNGSFSGNVGLPGLYGISGNMNYRTNKLNLFGSYGLNYRENPGGGFTDRTSYLGSDTLFTYIDNDRLRSGLSNNLRFGVDFYLNENNIITASALARFSDQENTTNITYFDRNSNEELLNNTLRRDIENEEDNNLEFQASYRRIFEGEGHELVAEVQFRDNNELELSSIDSANLLQANNLFEFQRSSNNEGDKNVLIQVDYVRPLSEGKKFEAGYRGTLREISSDFKVEQIDEQGNWQSLENFTNTFVYNEDVHAAYSIFENNMERWGYQLGMRVEQTLITTYQRETNQTNQKNYINAFPSAFVSYKLDDQKSLQASYSRRLSRPRFWYLNPFSSFSDPRNIRTGNTDLDPEYTNSYEVGWLNNLNKASLYLGGYYRFVTGVIERISTSEDGIRTISTPRNIGTENSYGIEANFSYDPTDWYNLNGNANFFRAITEGRFEELILIRDTYSARFRLNNRFKAGKVDLQVSGFYRAPEITTQGRRQSMYSVDLGANIDIFKGNGTLNFSVRDLFNTMKYRGTRETENFSESAEFQWRSREARLALTYRINQKKQRSRGGRGGYGGGEGMDF